MADMENIHKEITIPNRIFLKGFELSTEEEDLYNIFSKYGSIRETNIIRDPRTKQSKGYGFITFDSQLVAEKVIETVKSVEINGTEVVVGKAKIRRRPPTARYIQPNEFSNVNQPHPSTVVSVSPDGLFTFHQQGFPYIPQFVPINPNSTSFSFDANHGSIKVENYAINQMTNLPQVTSQQLNNNMYQLPYYESRAQCTHMGNKNGKEEMSMMAQQHMMSPPFPSQHFGVMQSQMMQKPHCKNVGVNQVVSPTAATQSGAGTQQNGGGNQNQDNHNNESFDASCIASNADCIPTGMYQYDHACMQNIHNMKINGINGFNGLANAHNMMMGDLSKSFGQIDLSKESEVNMMNNHFVAYPVHNNRAYPQMPNVKEPNNCANRNINNENVQIDVRENGYCSQSPPDSPVSRNQPTNLVSKQQFTTKYSNVSIPNNAIPHNTHHNTEGVHGKDSFMENSYKNSGNRFNKNWKGEKFVFVTAGPGKVKRVVVR